MRPVLCIAYVWCDHHGEIHAKEEDVYNEGPDSDGRQYCAPFNWRSVYVLGVKGEFGGKK